MQYYESGEKKSERHFKEGKQVGVFITWDLNEQKLSESNYNKYGQLHGLLTEWYKNGLRDLFTCLGIENNMVVQRNGTQTERKNQKNATKDGKENGLWTEWNEEGKKTFQGNFVDGNEQQFIALKIAFRVVCFWTEKITQKW